MQEVEHVLSLLEHSRNLCVFDQLFQHNSYSILNIVSVKTHTKKSILYHSLPAVHNQTPG